MKDTGSTTIAYPDQSCSGQSYYWSIEQSIVYVVGCHIIGSKNLIEHISVELTEKQQEQALARYEQIRPYLEEGVSQAELARVHQVPLPTLHRWVQRYREQGLAGLARQERGDAGQSRGLAEELGKRNI